MRYISILCLFWFCVSAYAFDYAISELQSNLRSKETVVLALKTHGRVYCSDMERHAWDVGLINRGVLCDSKLNEYERDNSIGLDNQKFAVLHVLKGHEKLLGATITVPYEYIFLPDFTFQGEVWLMFLDQTAEGSFSYNECEIFRSPKLISEIKNSSLDTLIEIIAQEQLSFCDRAKYIEEK